MNIVRSNGEYRFFNKVDIVNRLDPKNYLLKWNQFGIFLVETTDFEIPKKLYDVDNKFREMVLKSYHHNKGNTGVLCEGYKGQGKSVTAKLLCKESELPVIMIDQSIPREVDFVSFLGDIRQQFALFVDEFEKVFPAYDSDDKEPQHTQASFLSLTDGALSNSHKKLFIFTTNDQVDDKFLNRPSRIRFHKTYQFMPVELYNMIVDDLLEEDSFREDLITNLPIQEATIDLLISIINEVNIQGRPYSDFRTVFNHSSRRVKYKLSYMKGGNWKELGITYLPSEPVRGTYSVDGVHVQDIEDVGEDGIIFTSPYVHRLLPKTERKKEDETLWTYKFEKMFQFKEVSF